MSARDDFTAAAKAVGQHVRPGRRVVAATFCTDHPPRQTGPCPSCAFHEGRYSGEVRRLDRLYATLPALSEVFEVLAAFVSEYPALGREHVDGGPCGDYACEVVTRLRSIAQALVPAPPADGEQTGDHDV